MKLQDRGTAGCLAASFFLWGMLRSLDDVVALVFQRSHPIRFSTAMLIHTVFFSAYVVTCFPAARLAEKAGYRFAITCAVAWLCVGTVPLSAAVWHDQFFLCLPGAFAVGVGVAMLQTTGNSYISACGDARHTASRLLIVQSFQALGAIVSPLIASRAKLGRSSASTAAVIASAHLREIYISVFAMSVLILAAVLAAFRPTVKPVRQRGRLGPLLRNRSVRIAALLTFLFIGSEAAIVANVSQQAAQFRQTLLNSPTELIGYYWFAVLIGRLAFGRLLRRFDTRRMVIVASGAALTLLVIALNRNDAISAWLLAATGFSNALLFPAIYGMAVAMVSPHEQPMLSSLFATTISGGAVLPFCAGLLADHYGLSTALYIPMAAYVLIIAAVALGLVGRPHARPMREAVVDVL